MNKDSVSHQDSRRSFVSAVTIAGAGLVLGAPDKDKPKPSEVNATEDLMREHGVLNRVLLIYEEGARRINAETPPSADALWSAAGIIRKFIEEYHEKLEEEQVFPRLQKAGKLADLIRVLRDQHAAGQKLTAEILKNATAPALKNKGRAQALVEAIQKFIRMYRPHEAREDTVLFPTFHAMFSEEEFDKLGEQFEGKEQQLLGSAGFEGTVEQVAQLEKALGIYDLSKFTPA